MYVSVRFWRPLPRVFPSLHRLYSVATATLHEFMRMSATKSAIEIPEPITPPYLPARTAAKVKSVFIETYGCQMNTNDTEIVLGILQHSGAYTRAATIDDADAVLLMTCAIRENAESKIWSRLASLRALSKTRGRRRLTIGVLGCTAERLKETLLEKHDGVDVVCGPDAYRDLPRLLASAEANQTGVNVMLSLEETYADVAPVRIDPDAKSAYVSIMRGCDNMCAFCIVPFTRGRERSRPIESVVEEIRRLSDQGIKEVILLGQNVNSYRDLGSEASTVEYSPKIATADMSRGFKTVYKPKLGGHRFTDLLDRVSQIDGNMRIRFTSPHPKDFPDGLLALMRERHNICKQIHLPAQSGSTSMLERMRRGYTREAYLELVEHIRDIVPGICFSSDFISGFCGETEEEHQATVSLIAKVQYEMAYMYAYSMREKTMAHRRYQDDVPEEVKQKRLREVQDTFYSGRSQNVAKMVGRIELVLVDGQSKKSDRDLAGRSDGNCTIVFPSTLIKDDSGAERLPDVGDYVVVRLTSMSGSTPIGEALRISTLAAFERHKNELGNQ